MGERPPPDPVDYDLVIIGCGIYGSQVARTYLSIRPGRRVAIFESSKTIGSVWSRERVYEDFWTQVPLSILEFSDHPMQDVPQEDEYYGFFKAKHVTMYLEEYCRNKVFNGQPLDSRILLEAPVQRIYKDGGFWFIKAAKSGLPTLRCPKVPDLPNLSQFQGTIIHHKDFALLETCEILEQPKGIVVIGGAKSAADVVYSRAKAGHRVTWLIRKSASGPAYFISAKGMVGSQNSKATLYTKLTSLFFGSIFAAQMGFNRISRWINTSEIGVAVLRKTWQDFNARALAEADYDRADGKENGFFNLKPDTEFFWQNDSTGIDQRPDFLDLIARDTTVV